MNPEVKNYPVHTYSSLKKKSMVSYHTPFILETIMVDE